MSIFEKSLKIESLTNTTEKKTYTLAIATAAVVILMLFFAIRPAVGSILDRLSENKEKRKVITQMDAKYETLLKLNQTEIDRADALGLLDVAMPTERNEEVVVANIMPMLQENNLVFKSINTSENEGESDIKTMLEYPKYKNVEVNLEVIGQRNNIMKFIKSLEEFPRIMHVTTVTIMPSSDREFSGTDFGAQIDFEFYYYEE